MDLELTADLVDDALLRCLRSFRSVLILLEKLANLGMIFLQQVRGRDLSVRLRSCITMTFSGHGADQAREHAFFRTLLRSAARFTAGHSILLDRRANEAAAGRRWEAATTMPGSEGRRSECGPLPSRDVGELAELASESSDPCASSL
jgi:hypothetical protein